MSTYLELVQQLVTELGIGGANQGATVPTTVVGQKGQLWNATNWIKQADNNLNLLHTDWRFLAATYFENLIAGSRVAPAHVGSDTPKMWDRQSFWLERNTNQAAPLTWMEWEQYRATIYPGATPSQGKPSIITQDRQGTLRLDVPSDATYDLRAEFYRVPALLTTDVQVPHMPVEYHRLIVCEAAIKYGNKEAALEVINGMEAEYAFLLDKLEGDQLIGGEYDNQHSQDIPLVMDIPGHDETQDLGSKWRY